MERDPYHEGEKALQARAGVREQAEAVGAIVEATLFPAARRFLAEQRILVAASLDTHGRPWASLLTGAPGVAQAVDETMLRIAAAPVPGDPLGANLAARPELGLLAIDLRTRRRVRVNGRALLRGDGIDLSAEEVYGNCPKYIRPREIVREDDGAPGSARVTAGLTPSQKALVAGADTFFIASAHHRTGADASHRGGPAGFVTVHPDGGLSFPDFPGNNMFNTLGNLAVDPRVGLLFVDFEQGGVVQVTGTASLGDRQVDVSVEEVVAIARATRLRWRVAGPAAAWPAVTPSRGPASEGAEED
jgi:predicted pyridoxine 5'-phosphate oxidase superfamily flavin-nucleotide-binding protein